MRTTRKSVPNVLEEPDPFSLNKWLSRHVVEARREDGTSYPPKTIQGLLSGLLRYMHSTCIGEVSNLLIRLLFHLCSQGTNFAVNSAISSIIILVGHCPAQ